MVLYVRLGKLDSPPTSKTVFTTPNKTNRSRSALGGTVTDTLNLSVLLLALRGEYVLFDVVRNALRLQA